MIGRRSADADAVDDGQPGVGAGRSVLAQGGLLLLAAAAAQSIGNIVFHVVISRRVGAEAYGAVGAVLAAALALAVPLASVQLAVTRAVAEVDQPDVRPLLKAALRWSALAGGASFLVLPVLVPVLRVGLPLVALPAYAGVALMAAVGRGIAAGERRHGVVAASFVTGAGVRVALGLALAAHGDVLVPIVVTVVAEAVAALTAAGPVALRARRSHLRPVARVRWSDLRSTGIATLGLWAFNAGDALLARSVLTPEDAGRYIAVSGTVRALLVAPNVLLIVALPMLLRQTGALHRRTLRATVSLSAAVTIAGGAVLTLGAKPIVTTLYGASYGIDGPLVGLLSAALVATAVVTVYVQRGIGLRLGDAQLAWVGAVVQVVAVLVAPHTLTGLGGAVLVAAAVQVALSAVAAAVRAPEVDPALLAGDLYDPMTRSASLSIVVPFLDRSTRSARNAVRLARLLAHEVPGSEVIAVSDGSPAAALRPILDAQPHLPNLRLVSFPVNRGKGAAVRAGLVEARAEWVGYVDADGDIPFENVVAAHRMARAVGADVVCASKYHPLSQIVRSPARRLASRIFRLATRCFLRIPVRDTQCGLKVMRADVARSALPWMSENGFGFDVELLALANRLGFKKMLEMPVEIVERGSSTVSRSNATAAVGSIIGVARRLTSVPRAAAPVREDGPVDPEVVAAIARAEARTLRILLLSWRDPKHPQAGGAEVYLEKCARWWSAWGHDVTWFSAAVKGEPEDEVCDGIRWIRRGGRLGVYREAAKFCRAIDEDTYDLVIDVINTRPFFAPRHVANVPVVALAHQTAEEVWHHEAPLPVALLGRWLLEPRWLRRYARVPTLTVSESSRRSLERFGLRRLRVVPEGVHEGTAAARKAGVPVIAFCARLVPSKRPLDVLAAYERVREVIPDVELVMIGGGPLLERIRRMATVGVHVRGRISSEWKVAEMGRAHALVVTSVREGWGLVVSEAAAVGTRSVAYDVDGLRDSVAAAGGVLCDPTPEALAETLIEVLPRWMREPRLHDPYGGALPWRAVAAEVLAAAAVERDLDLDLPVAPLPTLSLQEQQ